MIRVNRSPDLHNDQIPSPWPVDAHKASGLVVRLVQAGVLRTLPPAVGALEGFELQPPLPPIPIGADLPAVPGTVHERALEQRRAARGSDRPEVALGPTQDVPGQGRGLAHGQVVR